LGASVPGRAWAGAHLGDAARRTLGTTLLLAIPILGYCLFGETRAVIAAEEPGASHLFRELLRGGYAVFFWSDLLIAVGLPLALIASTRTPTALRLGVAGGCMAVAVLLERGTLVVALLLGHAHRLYSAGGYAPGLDEIAATGAVYLAGLLAFVALAGRRLGRRR
ncbi:MAG TPA: hypothetical protein VFL90_01945, partial [Methylomirabilota bacterium]|nr:hypothetical protein [Methylomirabilota bacterium]